jgi:hypothetical protein
LIGVELLTVLGLGRLCPAAFGLKQAAESMVYYTVVRDGRFELLDDWKRWR